MPIARFEMPDGRIGRFEVPEGTTPEDAQAMIGEHLNGQQNAPEQPVAPQSEGLESKAVRATMGALDPVFGIAQAVPHALSAIGEGVNAIIPNDYINGKMAAELAAKQDAMAKSREEWYQGAKKADGIEGFDAMRMIGNIASPVNMALAPIASSIAGIGKGKAALGAVEGLLPRMAKGAAIGAGYAGTAPVTEGDYASGKAEQAGIGALTGGLLPAAGEAAARFVNPMVDKAQRALLESGVRLTPGQIMGGMAQKVEDKLTSVPILGDAITSARKRGFEDLNKAAANRALEPIGKKLPDSVQAGHDLVNYVDDTLGKEYDALLPKLTGKIDVDFMQNMKQLDDMVLELPESMQKQYTAIVENQLKKKISNNGTITGETMKEIESVLGKKARGYAKSQDYDQQQLGDAVRQVQANLRELLARQNPDHAEKLRSINEGWANYTRLRDASGSVGAKEGVFTPAQLSNKVRSMGGKNGYAKGDNLMQDLSDAGKSVLPSAYPDSGTAGRLLLAAGTGAGGYMLSPPVLGSLLGGAAMYTQPGQAMARYLLASPKLGGASQATADSIRKLTSPADLARFLMGGTRATP